MQVAKMGQILYGASRVLIWLGSTSLQTFFCPPGATRLKNSIADLDPDDFYAWLYVLCHSDARSQSLVNQIMSIVYNPYWYRVWIVQETALAQDAGIIFGDTLVNREYFSPIYFAAHDNTKPG